MGHAIHSPWYFVMNFGFSLSGILYGTAVILLHRIFAGRARRAVLTMGIIQASGLLIVSVFHEQSVNAFEMAVHYLGAGLIFAGAVVGMLMSAAAGHTGAPKWYRLTTAVVLAFSAISFATLFAAPGVARAVGGGALDQLAMSGAQAWQVFTGVTLLAAGYRRFTGLPNTVNGAEAVLA
ncbi:hypothetical protein [Dactylosporangium sp. CA-092794]|uniref:hypothetical protein n=1 Tax=Dactylosporangium sp. CA-092794 TaxID=3239929 RepID=UPI003D921AAB